MKSKRLVVGAVSALGLTLAATATQAGFTGIFDWTLSSCTGTNCSSIFLGYTVTDRDGSTIRWEGSVFARAGECLRVQVTSTFGAVGIDDEMVVVGPNGTVWRNDDFIGLLPRVAFVAPVTGWHEVTIARFNGAPTPRHDGILAYGRYTPGGNPNCASPTPGISPVAASKSQAGASAAAPEGASGTGR